MGPIVARASSTLVVLSCSLGAVDAPRPTAPRPFALQFVATYEVPHAPPGALRWLTLRRDGTYEAARAGSSAVDTGGFVASPGNELPLRLSSSPGDAWSATIEAYDGDIHVAGSVLAAAEPVGPVEMLCDATGGRWTDDDADAVTGLYCTCPSGTAYIPSAGGCVR